MCSIPRHLSVFLLLTLTLSVSMDPDRHLPIPGLKHPVSVMSPSAPDPQGRPIAPSATMHQHSLPSIRQLHPYLPPSGATQPHLPAQDSPSYGYAPLSGYAGPSGSTDPHSSQPMPPQGGMYPRNEVLDSEPEGETEQPGPAKKKRRRQALSCNGTSLSVTRRRSFLTWIAHCARGCCHLVILNVSTRTRLYRM